MGRTNEGSDDNPGRFASGFAQWNWVRFLCGSYLLRYTISPIRHERSHIMYWNCGKNRLMSSSNVSRDGMDQSPSLPWIQLSKSAGAFL